MSTDLTAGRANQKRRTYWALMDAADRLLGEGTVPTLEAVAEAAMVSRATAYRYFSSVDELVADVFVMRQLAPADEVLAGVPDDDLEARVLAVAEHLVVLLLKDEVALHTIARLFMNQWLSGRPDDQIPRPGRRLPLIDAALAPAAERLGAETTERLRRGLALVLGMEAVLTLRDVLGLDPDEALATTRWTVRALVAAAEREAAATVR